jgi:hypothetical protein
MSGYKSGHVVNDGQNNRDRVGHTVLYITNLWKLWKGKEIKTKEEEIK